MVDTGFAQSLGSCAEEGIAGTCGNVTSQDRMFLEVVFLPPRIEQQAGITRSDGSGLVANHEVLFFEPTDDPAGVPLVDFGRERNLTLGQERVGVNQKPSSEFEMPWARRQKTVGRGA